MSKNAKRYKSKQVTPEVASYHRVIKLTPRTKAQKEYINVIHGNELNFCTGSAGSGKTYVATTLACKSLDEKLVDRIILTRPAVTSGENFGFLPGTLQEKYSPYLEPFLSIFHEHFGASHTDNLVSSGKIVAKPLAFMRGVTFSNSFIILDEAQNTTPEQMKLFLTRLGEGNKVIVDGDVEQKDIKVESGLSYAIRKLEHLPNIGTFSFSNEDCIRSEMVRRILESW